MGRYRYLSSQRKCTITNFVNKVFFSFSISTSPNMAKIKFTFVLSIWQCVSCDDSEGLTGMTIVEISFEKRSGSPTTETFLLEREMLGRSKCRQTHIKVSLWAKAIKNYVIEKRIFIAVWVRNAADLTWPNRHGFVKCKVQGVFSFICFVPEPFYVLR